MRSEKTGHFHEVFGMIIVTVGGSCFAVDTLTVDIQIVSLNQWPKVGISGGCESMLCVCVCKRGRGVAFGGIDMDVCAGATKVKKNFTRNGQLLRSYTGSPAPPPVPTLLPIAAYCNIQTLVNHSWYD